MFAARNAVLEAIAAINCDIRRLARSSEACRRLMTIPGVGQLTAAFIAAMDGPDRFRTSRDVGPCLGLVPRRWKSGEIDYAASRNVAPLENSIGTSPTWARYGHEGCFQCRSGHGRRASL